MNDMPQAATEFNLGASFLYHLLVPAAAFPGQVQQGVSENRGP